MTIFNNSSCLWSRWVGKEKVPTDSQIQFRNYEEFYQRKTWVIFVLMIEQEEEEVEEKKKKKQRRR